jgi:putative redox protein
MVEIELKYEGNKKCSLTHQEGPTLQTDAPRDIGGDASAFSPTDLIAAGLAACILTTMAMFAERHQCNLTGVTAHVMKEMNSDPRRIGRLPVTVRMPGNIPDQLRKALETAGNRCPVKLSLHPDIDAPIEYVYE